MTGDTELDIIDSVLLNIKRIHFFTACFNAHCQQSQIILSGEFLTKIATMLATLIPTGLDSFNYF
jgi:hypothetical protein